MQDSRETREVDGMYERGNGSGSSAARGSSLTLRTTRTTSVASARLLQLTDSSGLRGPQGGWSTPALGYALRWPLFLSTSQKPLFDTPETPPLFSGSNHRTTARLLPGTACLWTRSRLCRMHRQARRIWVCLTGCVGMIVYDFQSWHGAD